jgi:hypothetical protein
MDDVTDMILKNVCIFTNFESTYGYRKNITLYYSLIPAILPLIYDKFEQYFEE